METSKIDDDVYQSEEGLIFNPYNENCVEITDKDIKYILRNYGITADIYNKELYKRAFIHKSYVKRPAIENLNSNISIVEKPTNCISLKSKSNERLEFIGDGVLELITKYYLYRRFPKADEGFMTEKKIALVKNEHIGKLALNMKLNKWFILSKNTEEKGTRTNLKKLGCLFEAFLGALFLDFNKIEIKDEDKWFENLFVCGPGFQMCQIFVENVFEKYVDWDKLINEDDNFKNILQVKIQKQFKTTPYYLEISSDLENGYNMGVYLCIGKPIYSFKTNEAETFENYKNFEKIQEKIDAKEAIFICLGTGSHKVKKKAEQKACEMAIKQIEIND